jgi:hypothetical protein
MLSVTWIKSTQNVWLPFETFNLGSVTPTTGVYVIWHGGQPPWTVRVGQGDIAERIGVHRGDQQVLAYRSYGTGLFVTWAAVPAYSLDGVERYLADQLRPLVGDRFPNVVPIPVNLPWAA